MIKLSIIILLLLPFITEVISKDLKSPAYDYAYIKGINALSKFKSSLIEPEDWWKIDPECKGRLQSPIDIEYDETTFDQDIGPIEIYNAKLRTSNKKESWEFLNDGKTVKLTPLNRKYIFNLLPRNELYELLQIHLHWRGSEHFINNEKYAAEIHLVFQSQIRSHYSVVGYLVKQVTNDNKNKNSFINELHKISKYNSSISVHDTFRLNRFVPMKVTDFYRYNGSLTTPGCKELVEWNVVDKPILTISEDQLLRLQTLLDINGFPILSNARPIQDLNDRVVYRSFDPFPHVVERKKPFSF